MLLCCRDSCSAAPLCQSSCCQAKIPLSSQPTAPPVQSSNLLCRYTELEGTTRYLLLASHRLHGNWNS